MANIKTALDGAEWHAAPPEWALTDAALTFTTGNETDFWQDTFYGFRRDDGHFLGRAMPGDFTAVVTFDADYKVLYDQAGLMMRADAQTWLKAGIEYSDGVTNFSTVVTRDGQSDWSVIGVPKVQGPQQVRLTRLGGAVILHFLDASGAWTLMRLANFPADAAVAVGPMACSPQRSGLRVEFSDFEISPPIDSPLHAS